MNVFQFQAMKNEGRIITATTAYDYWSAKILNDSEIDMIIVGDSVAMVVHGHPNTLAATTAMMEMHIAAVARGATDKFIVGDMPFLSFRKGLSETMHCVERLMRAGAHAVKLEGIDGLEDIVKHTVDSGVPVMGHLGLTPQSVHSLGGMKVQARDEDASALLADRAKRVEDAGAFSVVLECVSATAARRVTEEVSIPTIGIGAGKHTDGQVLVLHDILGFNTDFKPKFVRNFAGGEEFVLDAVNRFAREARAGTFPAKAETYS